MAGVKVASEQIGLFTPPKPLPTPTRQPRPELDLKAIREELTNLANMVDEKGRRIGERVTVVVKKSLTESKSLHIRETDQGFEFYFNPKRIKTKEQLDETLAFARIRDSTVITPPTTVTNRVPFGDIRQSAMYRHIAVKRSLAIWHEYTIALPAISVWAICFWTRSPI